jgi:hypothetical protein
MGRCDGRANGQAIVNANRDVPVPALHALRDRRRRRAAELAGAAPRETLTGVQLR